MVPLRNPILATLIYYDCFEFPLTLMEIHRYLVNPSRLTRIEKGLGEIKLSDVSSELDKLVESGKLGQKNGFYFLKERDHLYDLRNERQKMAARKWKKFLRRVSILSLAPYLRGVFASGSMAVNNTEDKSDFDVLIIAETGRLYTCRFFLWLVSSLAGVRRKRTDRIAPDKLCFNHYITTHSLAIKHESLFTAQTYSNLKPVMADKKIINEFYGANLWLNNYMYNFRPYGEFVRRKASDIILFRVLADFGEFVLNTIIGDHFENLLKMFQQRRIKNNPVTYESGGRIIFTDDELEFHPYSFEKFVLSKYREDLRRFGIMPHFEEKDSGLLA